MPERSSSARPGNARRPWYANGLRFECLPGCGACCIDHGDYNALYLTSADVRRLADHLELTRSEFIRLYTTVEDDYVLLRTDHPDCLFLKEGKCDVYEARPTQCRTFPFWKDNLRSRRSWVKLCEFCPGIDSGPLHDEDTISREVRKREQRS
jgi:Fe-S-cluster containining protein